MNKVLSLSGYINKGKNKNGGGGARIAPKSSLNVRKVQALINDIKVFKARWLSLDAFCDPIVSIRYIRRIPKSLRMGGLFKIEGISVNDTVIGASYSDDEDKKHIIVYRLPIKVLDDGIARLEVLKKCLSVMFGEITSYDMTALFEKKSRLTDSALARRVELTEIISRNSDFSVNAFGQLVQDAFHIEKIYLEDSPVERKDNTFISFYNVGLSDKEFLAKVGLPEYLDHIGNPEDGYSYLLSEPQLATLNARYPYLVSMSVSNYGDELEFKGSAAFTQRMWIPSSMDEPVIGVLDGAFDENVYFSDWVDYCSFNKNTDTVHGTAISSLIVDGPALNPSLEDHCGRFRVKHFNIDSEFSKIGVSTFELYENIEKIVHDNPKIKVWNLSWGTSQEIDRNSVSPIAALLDRLQHDYDVIFILSGTNNDVSDDSQPYVGSPADSINSIVVNSVDSNGMIPSYARKGPVLGFYQCPDLCAIGGSREYPMTVAGGFGTDITWGTSFAACWITRKVAYLIYILKFTREEAKALLIDSAYGWNSPVGDVKYLLGAGIVPTLIDDVLQTDNSEFKFIIKGTSEMYNTYSYRIPIPLKDDKFPFLAKATLCYFPECCRKQGVDYVSTELDLHFGRLNKTGGIQTINNNAQGDAGKKKIPESVAAKDFRKWDSTKHIADKIGKRNESRKVYIVNAENSPFAFWGFNIQKKQRLDVGEDKVNFALVATFRSIDGRNRINEFIQYARANGWIVSEIDVDVMNDIYEEEMADIEFTE